ncbi:inner membrane protein [Salmonella enterica subsp. enterica]|uniref:Inner membrane protein n=1 Tax=Salmonella enterica I TaxID=59201 RepID=A0A379WIS7_SALET|nr:inner membrane protein [Salmonella enterica subsp. enterica]
MSDIKSYISNQKNIIQHDDFLEEDWTLLFALIMVL